MVKDMNVIIPGKLIPYLISFRDGDTITEKVNLSLVLASFSAHSITLEKAAELAGMSIWDCMDVLKQHNIPWGEYSEEALSLDRETLSLILGEKNANA
jgi:predicted HTH domain antitoxin